MTTYNSEIVPNEHNEGIHKESYIYPEKRQKIIHDLRLNKNIIIECEKITKVSKSSQQNNSKTATSENDTLKKYLKQDIYLQKKNKKILII